MLSWLEPRLGRLRGLSGLGLGAPEPRWWVYTCELSRPVGRFFSGRTERASGASISGPEALRRALGEAVERWVGFGSVADAELTTRAVGDSPLFGRFPRCADDEPCPPGFRGLAPERRVLHAAMRRMADDAEVPVPAAYVHLGFEAPPSEPPQTFPISSGLAFHRTPLQAAWSGLCEVAERDAVMIAWWSRRPLPRLCFDGVEPPDPLAERLRRLTRAGLRAQLFDMTTDFRVPSVFCLLQGPARPFTIAAAAVADDPATACCKALDEAMLVRIGQCRHGAAAVVPSFEQFDWLASLEDHANLYAAWPDPPLDFLLASNPHRIGWGAFRDRDWWPPPRDWDGLAALARRLELQGLSPLWCDLTSDDARPLGCCIKVVVPQMVPLSIGQRARWLATPRLAAFSGGAGFNPDPHPFP